MLDIGWLVNYETRSMSTSKESSSLWRRWIWCSSIMSQYLLLRTEVIKRIDALEMYIWIRVKHISWTERIESLAIKDLPCYSSLKKSNNARLRMWHLGFDITYSFSTPIAERWEIVLMHVVPNRKQRKWRIMVTRSRNRIKNSLPKHTIQ